MANGKTTLEDFKRMDQSTRDYHIWNKLAILDTLHDRYSNKWVEKSIVWGAKIFGAIIIIALASMVIIQK